MKESRSARVCAHIQGTACGSADGARQLWLPVDMLIAELAPSPCREAHMKSGRAESEARACTRDKIAQLEDNTSTLKDYSWLSQARSNLLVI